MARALSLDLRERVIAAIEEGASCRKAAERFEVGVATAIRWHAGFRAEGEIAAKPMGGDRHSHRVEAHAALILQATDPAHAVARRRPNRPKKPCAAPVSASASLRSPVRTLATSAGDIAPAQRTLPPSIQ